MTRRVERDDAGFLEAVESSTDLEADVAVVGDVHVVAWIVPDFLGNAPGWNAHALVVFHWSSKIVVLDINAHVAGAMFGIGDGAVDVELCIHHGDSGGAGIAGVVEFVAADRDADAVSFGFVGADGGNDARVSNFAAGRALGWGETKRWCLFRWAYACRCPGPAGRDRWQSWSSRVLGRGLGRGGDIRGRYR